MKQEQQVVKGKRGGSDGRLGRNRYFDLPSSALRAMEDHPRYGK